MSSPSPVWLAPRDESGPAVAHAYRVRFWRERAGVLRLAVSADERYILFLDGEVVGRGPERGDCDNWFSDALELPVRTGSHVLVAVVWSAGEGAPLAQIGFQAGFYLYHQNPGRETDLSTGFAAWRVKPLPGHRFVDLGGRPSEYYAIGLDLEIDGASHPWGVERGSGQGWVRAAVAPPPATRFSAFGEQSPARNPRPGGLPSMEEAAVKTGRVRSVEHLGSEGPGPVADALNDPALVVAFQRLIGQGRSVILPAHGRWRVLIDLEDYLCAYVSLQVSEGAGAAITVRWAEALHVPGDTRDKGHRDEIEGKVFIGPGDRFLPDGGRNREFSTLWWRAGRYVQVEIATAAKPLRVQALTFRSTGYPLRPESRFASNDTEFNAVLPLCLRALQRCAHETYMDCPHYEQLMYAGDTRLEMLTHYALTRDDSLQRKCLALFDSSRDASGMIASRTPSRLRQVIPPFGFWWVCSVHDFALWRDDPAFVRQLLPGVRAVIEYGLRHRDGDGLVAALPGWNFVDWVDGWDRGVPPAGDRAGSVINWQFVLALDAAADLEAWYGDPALASRCRREAGALAERLAEVFWDERRGLFADDSLKLQFSEHAQALAIVSGRLPASRIRALRKALVASPDLARCSLYFSHYWFEACRLLGLHELWSARLDLWRELPENGFLTTPEAPGRTRSDCHAWSAHPLFHAHATLLGIRPVGPGFREVRIAPLGRGPGEHVSGSVVHPRGLISVDLRSKGPELIATVTLPVGVEGQFVWEGRSRPIVARTETFYVTAAALETRRTAGAPAGV